jgi:hypothetical protein
MVCVVNNKDAIQVLFHRGLAYEEVFLCKIAPKCTSIPCISRR